MSLIFPLILTIFACVGNSLMQTKSADICIKTMQSMHCKDTFNIDYGNVGAVWSCYNNKENPVISTIPDRTISSIVYVNGSLVDNMKVQAIYIINSDIRFLPRGLKTVLPSLKVLAIRTSGLLTVTKSNLEEFGGSLVYVAFDGNKLTSLDSDLFEFNSNLKGIYLYSNPLRHIEPKFFENLKSLKSLLYISLKETSCMDQYFWTDNSVDILKFIWNHERCFNETARIESMLSSVNGRVQNSLINEMCLDENLESSTSVILQSVEESAENSNARMNLLESLVRNLMNDNIELKQKIEKLTRRSNCRMDSLDEKLDRIINLLDKSVSNN